MSIPSMSEKLQEATPTAARRREPRSGKRWSDGRLAWLGGWIWRIAVGGLLCFQYFTSIAVVGWLYRWMQSRVLCGWWKQSRFRHEMSFREFCESLGDNGPSPRPRWLLDERFRSWWRTPWHSLWLNVKIGVQGLFCTYLATGWGCLIMFMSWEFGWLNSFNKGYEQAYFGPVTGVLGILLFIAAMFYVPMAQVHQAATGEARSFFHFRFVWALIRSRPTAYLGLAILTALLSLVFEVLRVLVLSDDFPGNAAADDAEGLLLLERYFLGCSFGLFIALLMIRGLAARIYRAAVLKVLRDGTVTRNELHPLLANWLERLELMPAPSAAASGLGQVVRVTTRWSYRRFVYALLFATWFAYVARLYAGYFLVASGPIGFLNHPLVQIPCVNHIPSHLAKPASESSS